MRERSTFVHGAHDAFDPEQLVVDQEAVQVRRLKAAREDRLTLGFSELPQEVLDSVLEGKPRVAADGISYTVC